MTRTLSSSWLKESTRPGDQYGAEGESFHRAKRFQYDLERNENLSFNRDRYSPINGPKSRFSDGEVLIIQWKKTSFLTRNGVRRGLSDMRAQLIYSTLLLGLAKMISLGRCPLRRPTSTEFSNRTLSRMRGLLSRPLEDEAQVKAEVQEKESRSVFFSFGILA